MIAEVAFGLKDYTVAQRWFQILADSPDDALVSIAHLRLGMICRARGHRDAARRHFTAIAERSSAAMSLGDMAQEAGDLDGARAWFERALAGDVHPDDRHVIERKIADVARAAGARGTPA
jgi:predicted negative regulator of RcsB-dependent stress response